MSNYTHETVLTKFIETKGICYAYRRFGKAGKVPLLLPLTLGERQVAASDPPSIPNATELRN